MLNFGAKGYVFHTAGTYTVVTLTNASTHGMVVLVPWHLFGTFTRDVDAAADEGLEVVVRGAVHLTLATADRPARVACRQ